MLSEELMLTIKFDKRMPPQGCGVVSAVYYIAMDIFLYSNLTQLNLFMQMCK